MISRRNRNSRENGEARTGGRSAGASGARGAPRPASPLPANACPCCGELWLSATCRKCGKTLRPGQEPVPARISQKRPAETQRMPHDADHLDPRHDTLPKPGQRQALDIPAPFAKALAKLSGPVVVRITRLGGRILDDDNLSGGCKQLRDAIAELLGRKGDGKADGLTFVYDQAPGEQGTLVEVEALP